jgi:aminoglycoside phosphotransferase (APT) family kinase protein
MQVPTTAWLRDEAGDVRPGEELDLHALRDYLSGHLPLRGELAVRQFPSGFSNLTYLLACGGEQWVLRRPPFGTKARSAHDMGREYRVLSALHKVFPYAPEPVLLCADENVLGASWYLMRHVPGLIIRRDYPRGLALLPAQVRTQFERWLDVLCELHQVDYARIGLGDLGRPAGYVRRQVEGWCRRYTAALTPDDPPTFETTIRWLHDHMPAESARIGLIHNDYKLDNVVWSLEDPLRLIAVLDWEMATLGDPLMDLGCTLGYWVEATDPADFRQFAAMPTTAPGAPTRRELIERFARNLNLRIDNFDFYFCFGLFRLAGIGRQIYYRYFHGQTRDPRFALLHAKVHSLHRMCARVIARSEL